MELVPPPTTTTTRKGRCIRTISNANLSSTVATLRRDHQLILTVYPALPYDSVATDKYRAGQSKKAELDALT